MQRKWEAATLTMACPRSDRRTLDPLAQIVADPQLPSQRLILEHQSLDLNLKSHSKLFQNLSGNIIWDFSLYNGRILGDQCCKNLKFLCNWFCIQSLPPSSVLILVLLVLENKKNLTRFSLPHLPISLSVPFLGMKTSPWLNPGGAQFATFTEKYFNAPSSLLL